MVKANHFGNYIFFFHSLINNSKDNAQMPQQCKYEVDPSRCLSKYGNGNRDKIGCAIMSKNICY